MRLGIDFGTTRTVVAVVDRGNYPVVHFVEAGGDARDHVPSVVAEAAGELYFGWEAAALAGQPGCHVVRSFKRILSDPRAMPDTLVEIGQVHIPLVELLRRFFCALREALLHRSNLPAALLGPDAPLEVVVATPANAFGAQRIVTLQAFRGAGFDVVAMLHEPSAAGFEYTHRHADTFSARRDQVVVYDLGGGTFDASLLRLRGPVHEVLATRGLHHLGGDDFDRVLADRVLSRAGLAFDALPDASGLRLLELCRDAKERLAPQSRRLSIELEGVLGEDAPVPSVTVPVAEFYEAAMPLVRRTFDAIAPILALVPEDTGLAGLYVVGGASLLPLLARALREELGLKRRVHRSPYASAAVAIGLAIAADQAAGYALTDRFSRTFGVFRETSSGREVAYDRIFSPDTPLPQAGGSPVVSLRIYRAAHNVGHYRFYEAAADSVDAAHPGDLRPFDDVLFPFEAELFFSEGRLRDVPVRRATEDGPLIEERYALDAHGIVEVTLRNLDAGYARTFALSHGRAP